MPATDSPDVREFSGSLRERPNLLKERLDFEARNVTVYRIEKHSGRRQT